MDDYRDFEIWSRMGPGDFFRKIMTVWSYGYREALDDYADNAGGAIKHTNFLVRVKGSQEFKLFRIDSRPTFMEI